MRFLPLLLLGVVLVAVVASMAGDRHKAVQAVGKMAFTIALMIVMAAVFAIIADA